MILHLVEKPTEAIWPKRFSPEELDELGFTSQDKTVISCVFKQTKFILEILHKDYNVEIGKYLALDEEYTREAFEVLEGILYSLETTCGLPIWEYSISDFYESLQRVKRNPQVKPAADFPTGEEIDATKVDFLKISTASIPELKNYPLTSMRNFLHWYFPALMDADLKRVKWLETLSHLKNAYEFMRLVLENKDEKGVETYLYVYGFDLPF